MRNSVLFLGCADVVMLLVLLAQGGTKSQVHLVMLCHRACKTQFEHRAEVGKLFESLGFDIESGYGQVEMS